MILDSKGNGRSETLGAGANGETNSYAAASSADNGRRTAGTSPNGSSAVTQSSPEDLRGVQSNRRADAPGSASSADSSVGVLPALSLPKGGGALRGIGEKFAVNAATGSASFSIPVGVSPGRDGFGPSLELNYSAGAGNSVYGAGWQLGLPSISRRTEKGLPRYLDAIESDVFVLSGAEELVPALDEANLGPAASTEGQWRVRRYRPRVETDFSRVERWTHQLTGDVHWQVTSRDNITRVFGRSAASRIVDPKQPARIFSWLLEETRDDRGNVTLFEYKAEDGAGVSALHVAERARFEFAVDGAATFTATAQRYLKRISYGNRQPFVAADFMFQLVLDYGEHQGRLPTPNEAEVWPVRQDPFSTHRAGFDVRSYRLCQRFLMFHQFPELGNQAELVRSTTLQYRPSRTLTKLLSVVHTGHGRASDGSPTAVALPAVTLDYTESVLHTQLTFLPEASLTGIRGGVETNGGSIDPSNNGRTQWVDLDGEGIPGVLLASDSALYYKRNLGAARLTSAEVLSRMPVGSAGSSDLAVATRSQLTDWNGDGRLEWVEFRPERVSAYTRKADCACDPEADFTPYYTLPRAPNLDWNDPNLRFVDLDGDGRADLLITEHDCFVWYQFREQEGYAAPQVLSKVVHEDQGPTVVFASRTEGIQLVDMCGDGLVDVVRVRNGEVCYWPNLGYGKFGKKITLAGSPHFAAPDQFDPSRVRFADVDGSGSADVLYVGAKGVSLWSNEAGNALSAEQPLTGLPSVDLASQVSFVDLFGNGTACLVWSSPWRNGVQPVAYVDLMGGLKPHSLISIVNILGSETRIRHRSSVDYYLQDKEAGKPWLTRLPFPVQVVDRVEHFDRVAGSRLVQRYQYHHGFYDGVEREFRGFAMVEQFDAEVFGGARGVGLFPEAPAAERSAPPIHTKTWFHTGAYLEAACLERELAREYFAQDPDAPLLPDAVLPAGLAPRERREAARALRGQVLRQEVYADDDNSVLARVPYSVSEANYSVRREQPRQGEVPGVFFTHPSTRLTLNYERNTADPRTSQECVIDVDAFGNVRASASIGYPRRNAPQPSTPEDPDLREQGALKVLYTQASFANTLTRQSYRLGVAYEQRAWELVGLAVPAAGQSFAGSALQSVFESPSTTTLPYEAAPSQSPTPARRLVAHARQYFYDDLLSEDEVLGTLPLGQVGLRALPREGRALAFTPGMLSGNGVLAGKADAATLLSAGYRSDQGAYWTRSGRRLLDASRFYRAVGSEDPFGNRHTLTLDAHALLVTDQQDALGNAVHADNDYRVLGPWQLTDPNGNRSAVAFDALGRPVASAVMGKVGEFLGDSLADPTLRFEYHLDSFAASGTPVHVRTFAREQHGASNPRFQESVSYSDGFGRELLTKVQAEPGLAPVRNPDGSLQRNPDGSLLLAVSNNRWVGTGRTLFDNKGNPVKRYEPYFSDTDGYETETELVEFGVTPLFHYDSLGRLIRTQNPDGSEARVTFDNWSQSAFDPNDAVRNADGSPSLWLATRQSASASAEDQRSAQLTLAHVNTPTVTYLDSLGRPFVVVTDNATFGKYATRSTLDIEGNILSVTDARGIVTIQQTFDVLGRRVHTHSPDAGTRWTLPDVANKPLLRWDSRGQVVRLAYDELERPTEVFVTPSNGSTPLLVQKTVYGETHPQLARNLRGRVYQVYDGAGVVSNLLFDFKGNLLDTERRLSAGYTATADWSPLAGLSDIPAIEAAASSKLEAQTFAARTDFDALNRITLQRTPDNSTTRPVYNAANLLQAVYVVVKGAAEQSVVDDVSYNARGQRERVSYANGTQTQYTYDALTFRLQRLLTTSTSSGTKLQDLRYTYDPIGNILDQRDRADFSPVFTEQSTTADGQYTYDAVYRLIEAHGREHPGQQPSNVELPRSGVPHVHDVAGRLIPYGEFYTYDEVGNIRQVVHQANGAGWTRDYNYAADNNRLLSTSVPGGGLDVYDYANTAANSAGAHGSMTSMPHLTDIEWDYADRMQHANLGGGGDVYFTYDASGNRVRKVWVHGNRVDERVYLGGFEIYREHTTGTLNGPVQLERETLHVFDNRTRVAMVETKTVDTTGSSGGIGASVWRFQLSNHLGSSALELTHSGGVISYEEYHPFGSTAFHTVQGSLGVSAKRYRYTGKERDEETGLYYHGARYYAPWLGRWTAADPLGLVEPGRADLNLYAYVRGNPISRIDPQGLADTEPVAVPFGPNGANPGTVFVFGEGKDRLVNGDAFKQVSEGKQLFRYDPKANLPGGLADRLSPEQFTQAVKNILGGALVESGAQSDAGTQAPGEGGAVEESFGTQAAQLAGRLSGESGEAGGSEFGVPGGGAATGGALDNEAGQVLAAGAVITDAVSSIVNLGKLAVKLGTVIAKKAVDIAARSVSKSVAKEVAKDLEAVAASGGAQNIANGRRLGRELAGEEAASIFTKSGGLRADVIAGSRVAVPGSKIRNQGLVQRLTADGSSISDWAKMTTDTIKSPSGPFQVHFYQNLKTGAVHYADDFKAVFNHNGVWP